MWTDGVSKLGPLTYESGALLTALHGPAILMGRGSEESLKVLQCAHDSGKVL